MRSLYLLCLSLCLSLSACASRPTPGPEASSLLPTGEVKPMTAAAATPEIDPAVPVPGQVASLLPGHPLTTATGNPEIDPVLTALSTGDRLDLIERFEYLATACQTVTALGGPPACRPGEPEGTVVSVLPVLSSEGNFIYADSVDAFNGLEVTGIYAIFQNSDSAYAEELFPAGKYTILVLGTGTVPGYALRVAEGRIVRLEYYFDLSAFETVQARDAADFILEPMQ